MANNRGTAFERQLDLAFGQYANLRVAKIHKVDPPTKTVMSGPGRKPRTFHLENPWLDYAGTWTAKAGRTIILEAKTTEKPALGINRHGGITEAQWANLKAWRAAGAACFLIWQYQMEIRIVTLEIIQCALEDSGRVSLRWADAIKLVPGTGYATQDILATASLLT